MPWSESNASRRQLLGQLSGQFADLAKARAARRGQTQDILAGFGQTALGYMGEKGLEKQRQGGRLELAGAESGYRTAEEAERQRLIGENQRKLQEMINEFSAGAPTRQEEAKYEALRKELEASGLSPMEFYHGYPPVGGEKEDPMAQLRKPSVYAAWSFSEYLGKEGLDPFIEKLPIEQREQYVNFAMNMLTADYPDMPDWEKASFKQAFMAQAAGVAPGQEEVVSGKRPGALSDTDAPGRRARNAQMMALVPNLKKKLDSLHPGDPQRDIINNLLVQTLPSYRILDKAETFNSWMRRAREALGATMMPSHGGTQETAGERPF